MYSPKDAIGVLPGGYRKILVFKPDVSKEDGIRLARSKGFKIGKTLPLINGITVHLRRPEDELHDLAAVPEINWAEDDGCVRILRERPRSRKQVIPWGTTRIRAPQAWARSRGSNSKVAVIDTGVDVSHPDLRYAVKESVTTLRGARAAVDGNGHGTHVAGIIAACDDEHGIVGVAPEAHLYSVRVFDRLGRSRISDIIEGLAWCVERNLNVINMSFGTAQESQAMRLAIDKAAASGAVLVAAAGNEGRPNSVLYPARCEGVLAVSAVDSEGSIAGFSSRGPEVNLAAPGVEIYSTYSNKAYMSMSGTSMAAPFVSGAAALVWSLDPNQTAEDVVKALTLSAEPLSGLGPHEQGFGMVDANAAVTRASDFFR